MAIYRQIHTKIWKDGWFIELRLEEKLLFLYLFSNELSSISGIYELPERVIEFETGIGKERVRAILTQFGLDKRVHYQDGVVWVVNLRKYHRSESPQVKKRIAADFESVPAGYIKNQYAIQYGYHIETVSIPQNEQEKEGEGREKASAKTPEVGHPIDTVSIPPSSYTLKKESSPKEKEAKKECARYVDFRNRWISEMPNKPKPRGHN